MFLAVGLIASTRRRGVKEKAEELERFGYGSKVQRHNIAIFVCLFVVVVFWYWG